jgi:hypothetical protein
MWEIKMKSFVKNYWKHLLLFALAGLVGGFLAGLDLLASYPREIQEQILAQGMSETTLAIVTGIQYAVYGLVLGVIGIILAKKIGLWNDSFSLKAKPLVITVILLVICGILFVGIDYLVFGKLIPPVADSYLVKPTVATVLGAMILGGVVEEVMLRLFMMSLIAFILLKLFKNCDEKGREIILAISNIASAMLFAAAHLPTTAILFGITPVILIRCFLLNGGFGLAFGWLYRKHGIQYAMIAHAGVHLVSKVIWILFI